MNKADVPHLFNYMYWANSRLLEAAAALPRDQFVEPGTVTTRDLRATLVHELDVEWSWRLALQGTSSEEFDALPDLRPEDYADVAALREHWVRDEADMRAWLAQMTDDQLAADATPALSGRALPMWRFLLHICFHAAQQQADAATLLTLRGRSPGDLGYLEWLNAVGYG